MRDEKPNLNPPIVNVDQAIAYRSRLEKLEPRVTFLMTLYLHPSITPETIRRAREAGVVGVKSYPSGVTTNSEHGVLDYAAFDAVFAEMERQNLVLNIHGECPSSSSSSSRSKEDINVFNAEEAFLATLFDLHRRFPRLRIVLEHITTEAGLVAVRKCGPTVVGTITAHHLFLTTDDWAKGFNDNHDIGNPYCYCKPVAKSSRDRDALIKAVVTSSITTITTTINNEDPSNSDAKFFFGSDSAPHPKSAKVGTTVLDNNGDAMVAAAAGIFTQPFATQLVVDSIEAAIRRGLITFGDIDREKFIGFLSRFGEEFYFPSGTQSSLSQSPGSTGLRRQANEWIMLHSSPRPFSFLQDNDADAGIGDGNDHDDIEERRGNEEVKIPETFDSLDRTIEIVPFRAGQRTWHLRWLDSD